jgi:uncharacterized membrane protein
VELIAKAPMPEIFKNITTWLATSGIKVLGILIAFIILSQMSKWIVKWLEKFIPEKVENEKSLPDLILVLKFNSGVLYE